MCDLLRPPTKGTHGFLKVLSIHPLNLLRPRVPRPATAITITHALSRFRLLKGPDQCLLIVIHACLPLRNSVLHLRPPLRGRDLRWLYGVSA